MKTIMLAATLAAFLVSPAHAEPISLLVVSSIGLTGTTAAIASSVLTLGIGLGLSFIPGMGKNR